MLNGEEKETQDVISENTKIKDLDEEKANFDAHLGEIEKKGMLWWGCLIY